VGNITGAMVFQASIGTSVALLFAPRAWSFEPGTQLAFASALIAFLSAGAVFAGSSAEPRSAARASSSVAASMRSTSPLSRSQSREAEDRSGDERAPDAH